MSSVKEPVYHIGYLDGLRVVSAFVVVMVHAASARVSRFPELANSEWMTALYFDVFFRIPVPIFLAISGLLIIASPRKLNMATYYPKRLKRLLPAMIFWCAFHFFWINWYYSDPISPKYIFDVVKSGMTETHLYYFFVILGLYAIAPLLKWVFEKSQIAFALITIGSIAVSFNGYIYNLIPLNWATYFLPFLMYFCLGAYASRFAVKPWMFIASVLTIIVTGILILNGTVIQHFDHDIPELDYRLQHYLSGQHIYVVIQSTASFIALRYIFEWLPSKSIFAKVTHFIAPAMFGVYLMHVALLDVTRDVFNSFDLSNLAPDIILETLVVFIAATILSLIVMRIKYLNKLIS